MVLSVQYLRGIAACLVLFEHIGIKAARLESNLLSQWHIGGAGVDLFFLISGFIMCHTTLDKHQTQGSVRGFLSRRIKRIIPLYWLVTCLALAVYVVMPSQVNSQSDSTDLLASFLLLPSEGVYLVANGWTLRYEFLFYGIFMLGLLWPRRLGHGLVMAMMLMMVLYGQWQPQDKPWGMFLTDAILLEFCLGMLLFYYYRSSVRLPIEFTPALLLFGCLCLAVVNGGLKSESRLFDFGLPMFLIMLAALTLEPILQKRPSKFWQALGDSSYAMYLIHPFVLVAGTMALTKLEIAEVWNGALFIGVLLMMSLIAGYVLYQLVEKPMSRFRMNTEWFSNKAVETSQTSKP